MVDEVTNRPEHRRVREAFERPAFFPSLAFQAIRCFDSGAASGWAYLEYDTGIRMILPYIIISPPKYWILPHNCITPII
jgi:hypothetical protein